MWNHAYELSEECGGVKENWWYNRVDWYSRAMCVEVVWTLGENGGGAVDEEDNGIKCEVLHG